MNIHLDKNNKKLVHMSCTVYTFHLSLHFGQFKAKQVLCVYLLSRKIFYDAAGVIKTVPSVYTVRSFNQRYIHTQVAGQPFPGNMRCIKVWIFK